MIGITLIATLIAIFIAYRDTGDSEWASLWGLTIFLLFTMITLFVDLLQFVSII